MKKFFVQWLEDGTATVLARVTARQGSGSATGVAGEGNWLKQVDFASITRKVYDLDSSTPDTPVDTKTLTVSDVILDTPDTTNVLWTLDKTGYNFIDEIANTLFPVGNRRYSVVYRFVLTGGQVFYQTFEGTAEDVRW